MKRVLRWARRILLGACLLVFVIVGTLVAVLHTDWGRNRVRDQIESALTDTFPGGAKVGRLEGSVFGEVTLRDIEIDSRDHRPFIEVETLHVKLGIWSLFKRHVHVDEAIAEGVKVSIRPQPPAPPKPPSTEPASPSKWSVALPEIEVHDGSLLIDDQVVVDHAEITAGLRIPAGEPLEGDVQLGAQWKGRQITVVGSVRSSDAGLAIPSAIAMAGEGWLTARDISIGNGFATGNVAAFVPATLVAAIRPGTQLPGDAIVAATASAGSIDVTGTLGAMTVHGAARGDFKARSGSGVFAVTGADLAPLGWRGRGDVIAAFVASDKVSPDIRGMVKVVGTIGDVPTASVMVAGHLVGEHGSVLVIGSGAGHSHVSASATLARKGPVITLAHASVVAAVDDPIAASGGLSPVAGAATVKFDVVGPLRPAVDLHVVGGTVTGKRVRFDDYAVATVDGRFDVDHVPQAIAAVGDVNLDGVSQAGLVLGKLSVRGSNNVRTKTIAVTATARPAKAALTAVVDASITRSTDAITVAIGRHTITGDNGVTWTGRGGSVVIDDKDVAITGIRSENAGGAITASARVDRLTKVLTAKLGATAIPMSLVAPAYRGTLAGTADLTRRGRSITGTATVAGTAIALEADAPAVDTSLTVALGRKVDIHAQASNPQLGTVKLASTIKPPVDLTDVVAWQHLERTAIETATLTLEHIDAGAAAKAYAHNDKVSGVIDSQLELAGLDGHGSITVTGVDAARAGTVDAVVTIAPDGNGDLHTSTKLTAASVGEGTVDVDLALPGHLFDPTAWRTLGNNLLRGATAKIADVVIDDALVAKLGLDTPYRGHVAAKVDIAAGARRVDVAIDGTGIHGGTLAKPIEVHAQSTLDSSGSQAQLVVRAGTTDLVTAHAKLPVTPDRMLAMTKADFLVTPLSGTVAFGSDSVPSVSIPQLLAVIGRNDATGGRIDGEVDISGTIGTPIADAPALTVRDLGVVARVADRPPPTLDRLAIAAHWGGSTGRIEATGTESAGGSLHIVASGRPDLLSTLVGSLQITKFDLSPLAILLPTRLLGAAGTLDADVTLRGDPRTTPVIGQIHLTGGRLPLSSTAGTLRAATVDIKLQPKDIVVTADGKIGAGTVHLEATATGDGTLLVDRAHILLNLRKFSPIGAVEPDIDGDIEATLMHVGDTWNGPVKVKHGNVVVTSRQGDKLLAVGVPSDLHLDRNDKASSISFTSHHAVDHPLFLLDVTIEESDPVNIRASIDPVDFRGTLSGHIAVSIGDDIGINDTLKVDRGDLDLFGHRYQVDHARMTFVDSIDPELDILLVHDFPDITLKVGVSGLLSAPERRITTDPDRGYDDAQLYGFVLGGEPGGDPNTQSREAASAAGASILSAKVSKYIKKVLPFGLDVIRYEAATSSNSQALVFGRWVNSQLFIGYRQHLEPRPDENNGELSGEYYLRHNILIETTFGDRQYEGLDLLWRRRY